VSFQSSGKPCWITLRAAAEHRLLGPRQVLTCACLIAAIALTGCAGHTTSATNITATGATLNASVQIGPNDHGGVFWFEYSRDNGAHWTQSSHLPWGNPNCSFNPGGTQSSPIPLSQDVAGLAPNSNYIFRFVGTVCNSSPIWLDSAGTANGTNYSSFTTRGPSDQGNGTGARYTSVLCYPGIASHAATADSFGYGLFIFNGDTSVTHQADCGANGLELDAVSALSAKSPSWSILPPQGTTFSYVSAQDKASGASGWTPAVSANATDGSGAQALPGLAATDGLWHTGDVSGSFNSVAMSLKCPTACASSDPRAFVSSRRFVLAVKDSVPPSIVAGGNLFSPGTKAGKQTLLVDGVDNGGGIRQFYLKVNGTPTSQVTLPCDLTTIDDVTVARSMPPCPALVPEDLANDVTLTADTSSAPFVAGANSVQACDVDYSDAAAAGYPGNTKCTVVKTVDVASDGVGPDLTFSSTYSPASPNDYSLHVHAVDKGAQPSGVQRIDVLLNGQVSSTTSPCNGSSCPQTADVDWSHHFNSPLDGSDHLTMIATDAQGNVKSSDFDLPSQVVHARLYEAAPAQGGQVVAQEWGQVGTHDSRRQGSDQVVAGTTAPCPGGSGARCPVLDKINNPPDGSAPTPQDYSEVSGVPLGTGQGEGPNSGGTFASVDIGSQSVHWINPGNAATSDNAYATTINALNPGQGTHWLQATNFGFSIPSGATILGIQAEAEISADQGPIGHAGYLVDRTVKLIKGGVVVGTDHRGDDWPTSDAYRVYGGAGDLWGATWTPADINAANFGIALSAINRDPQLAVYGIRIDHIRMTVYYDFPGASSLSEAASLLVPAQADFGSVISSGSAASVLQSWQTPPPGSNGSYQLVRSSKAADANSPASTWDFWVDAATKLPLKASYQSGSDPPIIRYYDYDTAETEAGSPPASVPTPTFTLNPPTSSSCLASGHLGDYQFNSKGMVYGDDPGFNALVNTAQGPLIVSPQGAAGDGDQAHIGLTRSGVDLTTTSADLDALKWDVTLDPNQQLATAGGAVIVETADGQPAAIVQSDSGNAQTSSVTPPPDQAQLSGDEVVLGPQSTATLSIQPILNDGQQPLSLCMTQADVNNAAIEQAKADAERAAASPAPSSASATRQIVVWVNPHPALSNITVSVQGNNGNCTATQKTTGSDGRVVFGGCPLNHSFTVSVPQQVTAAGVAYQVPDSSRTFQLTADRDVHFNYYPIAAGSGSVGGGDIFSPASNAFARADDAFGADAKLNQLLLGATGCAWTATDPNVEARGGDPHAVVKAWVKCHAEAHTTKWSVIWKLQRLNYQGMEWNDRADEFYHATGPTVTTVRVPNDLEDGCRGSSRLHHWRMKGNLFDDIRWKKPGYWYCRRDHPG
jgi:hypothetical protein